MLQIRTLAAHQPEIIRSVPTIKYTEALYRASEHKIRHGEVQQTFIPDRKGGGAECCHHCYMTWFVLRKCINMRKFVITQKFTHGSVLKTQEFEEKPL